LITPTDIQKKALRQYKDFLKSVLKREHIFPLYITGNKGKASMPLDELYPALCRLLEGAKSKKGFGYTVTLKTVQTRHAGEISMPDDIYFENVEDYLKFIDKEKEFLAFRKVAMQTQKQLPQLLPWMQEQPLKVIKYLTKWTDLLKVGIYFLKHPQPNLYPRQLLIDVPATFIEKHQSILSELLEVLLPSTHIRKEAQSFHDRFYLKNDLPLIRVRALAVAVFPDLPIQDVSLRSEDWEHLKVIADTVFITTDKLNFLRFPAHPNSCIIWGNPTTLQHVETLSFLANKQLYFWGDISLNTFQQLILLRQNFPDTQPFLINSATYKAFQAFATTSKKEQTVLTNALMPEEQEFFLFLKDLEEKNVIEQQHITQSYLQKTLNNL